MALVYEFYVGNNFGFNGYIPMSDFQKDLTQFLVCNKLPDTIIYRILAVLIFPGVQVVLSYRIRCWLARHNLGIIEILWMRAEELIFPTAILRYYGVKIGSGLYVPHPIGIVIGGATIGRNFTISQNCSVGGRKPVGAYGVKPSDWYDKEHVVIGDWVFMGAGSCILGPVKIGNNIIIGANSVVTKDIPSSVMVAGAPARIIRRLKPYTGKD